MAIHQFMDIWTLELRPGVREESASPAWLAALVIFRTLISSFIARVRVKLWVNYHKRNTSIQKQVNFFKVKVTMTQNRSIFASAVIIMYLWMIMLLTSYSKDKREKEAKYWSLSQSVKVQPSCNSLVALYFWRSIFMPLNHICIELWKQIKGDDRKTPWTSKDKKIIGQGQ